MKIDVTLKVTPKMVSDAQGNEKKRFTGHLGTHFDVMNKIFPIEYTERKCVVFDVRGITDRDIELSDIDIEKAGKDMFAAFCTGWIEKSEYGTREYFKEHPQLSQTVIDALLDRGVSIIGIDARGVRRGSEHTPADRKCAERGTFILENMVNLSRLLPYSDIVMNTYPMNFAEMSGLPCRVIADVK